MTTNGAPIRSYVYQQKAPVTVTYTLQFEQAEARAEAGLSIEEYAQLPGNPCWVDCDNPTVTKAEIIMWFRIHRAIPAVVGDAQAREMQRKRGKFR
ncbi:MAG: hypothetical protein L0Z53_00695 [Acidobacteriales bacterium]|nr:hypothetical protein [Terriglobales bacterium]